MYFLSDNTSGILPPVAAAFAATASGFDRAYGADAITQSLDGLFSDHFQHPAKVVLTTTGTAGNTLALSMLCASYEAVLCHATSHIHNSEAGAPEFFTQGAKLIPVAGDRGLIDPDALEDMFEKSEKGFGQYQRLAVLSLTQPNDLGQLYSPDHLRRLCDIAHAHGAVVHMDGARFPHVIAAQGLTPAEASWKAGVDVLTFGGTKCGGYAAEAIVIFNEKLGTKGKLLQKRTGQTLSKMRFISCQWPALLADDAAYQAARHGQQMAERLEGVLTSLPQIEMHLPRQINMVYVKMDHGLAAALKAAGVHFHVMDQSQGQSVGRFVTSFETSDAELAALQAVIDACKAQGVDAFCASKGVEVQKGNQGARRL